MTCREALKILMLSPFYFKLNLPERKTLLKEFLDSSKKLSDHSV